MFRQTSDGVEDFIRLISPGLDRKPRPLSYEWVWSEVWTRLHRSLFISSWECTERALFKLVSVVFKFTADFLFFFFSPCKCQEVKRNSESDDHEKSAHKPEKLQEIKDNCCSFVFWNVLQETWGLAADQEEETLSYLLIFEKCEAAGSV